MKHLNEQMSIHQVLQAYPFLMETFKQHGLGKFENPEVLEKLGPLLKLKTALSTLAINREIFMGMLEDRIQEQRQGLSFTLADDPERQGELTLLALLPCGMKMPFSRGFDAFASEFPAPFRYMVEGNMNHELSYNAYMGSVATIEELPDIVISADINSFYHPQFRRDFLEKGYFTDIHGGAIHPDFDAAGYADPDGNFTMLSGNLLVLVAIDRLAGGLPKPTSWEDLLAEDFTNRVVMRGQREFFCNGVLLPFFAMHGMEGVTKLARSIHSGCHPSEMVKLIDSGRDDVPPFYLMPHFFAQKIKRQDRISIIVPEEGAIVSPVQMLVKTSKREELREITDFLCGQAFGQMGADTFFPSTHPGVDNHLEGVPLFWLGWNFLKSRDIGQLKGQIKEAFAEAFLRTGGVL